MSLSLSLAALQATVAENTGEGFLALVTVTIPGQVTPLRLVFNTEPVVSRGNTFVPAMMDVRLSDQVPGEPGQATFSLMGVPQSYIQKLLNVSSTGLILVDVEYVLISDTHTVQRSNTGLSLNEFTLSSGDSVKGRLLGPTIFRQAYPGTAMDQATVPGIFKTTP